MVRARKWIAVAMLLVPAGAMCWVSFESLAWRWRIGLQLWGMLIPELMVLGLLGATIAGIVRERWWGRWLGLGVGLTWTTTAGLDLAEGLSSGDPWRNRVLGECALGLGGLLLASLTGRRMRDRCESGLAARDDGRLHLVRATVATSLMSLFWMATTTHTAFSSLCIIHLPPANVWGPAMVAMALALPGLLLLARGKTAGLFLVGAGCVAKAAALAGHLSVDRSGSLFDNLTACAMVLPGLGFGVATVAAYARPIWRFMRGAR